MGEERKRRKQLQEEVETLRNRVARLEALKTRTRDLESSLERSEELNRLVFCVLPYVVFVVDGGGRFQYISPNVTGLFGYTKSELTEMGNYHSVLGPDLYNFNELKLVDELSGIERDIVDKEGRTRHLAITVACVSLETKEVLIACRDATTLVPAGKQNRVEQTIVEQLLELCGAEASTDQLLQAAIQYISANAWPGAQLRGAAFMRGEDPNVLEMRAQHGFDASLQQKCARVPVGECLCGKVAQTGKFECAFTMEGAKAQVQYCSPILGKGGNCWACSSSTRARTSSRQPMSRACFTRSDA